MLEKGPFRDPLATVSAFGYYTLGLSQTDERETDLTKRKTNKKLKRERGDSGMDNNAQNSQNVQDGFLNNLRKDRVNVTIYLMGGVKLTGKIRSFDKFSLVLESGNLEQLIFKHAISTISVPRGSFHYPRSEGQLHHAQQSGPSAAPPAPAASPPPPSSPGSGAGSGTGSGTGGGAPSPSSANS